MSQSMDSGQRRTLDDEQKTDARQMIGCGWSVRDTAKHFGFSEERLRIELGLPVWKREPEDTREWWKRGGDR